MGFGMVVSRGSNGEASYRGDCAGANPLRHFDRQRRMPADAERISQLPHRPLFDISRNMDSMTALDALSALSQRTRLDAFRLLVRREPEGLAAGEIARLLDVPANTLSSHLAILARAGLVRFERHSRTVQYRADIDGLRALMLFLAKDCCAGNPDLCGPLLAELTCC
jgi:DNA-binding transcriptional ArsR family regulator